MKKARRILCAHDLSCVGRCSLSCALPILSAAGLEACPVPTALLSTQTGGMEGFTFLDLTEEMHRILTHWEQLHLEFDGIYSGYLGSPEQIPLMENVLVRYPKAFTLIDPVLGDGGELYAGFDASRIDGYIRLMSHADLTTPNLTEACLLTGTDPKTSLTSGRIRDLCKKIRDLGAGQVVLTGINNADTVGCWMLDTHESEPRYLGMPEVEGVYHGCGDIFASVLMACRMRGLDLEESCWRAAEFTRSAILRTRELDLDPRLGMDFERDLARFASCFSDR